MVNVAEFCSESTKIRERLFDDVYAASFSFDGIEQLWHIHKLQIPFPPEKEAHLKSLYQLDDKQLQTFYASLARILVNLQKTGQIIDKDEINLPSAILRYRNGKPERINKNEYVWHFVTAPCVPIFESDMVLQNNIQLSDILRMASRLIGVTFELDANNLHLGALDLSELYWDGNDVKLGLLLYAFSEKYPLPTLPLTASSQTRIDGACSVSSDIYSIATVIYNILNDVPVSNSLKMMGCPKWINAEHFDETLGNKINTAIENATTVINEQEGKDLIETFGNLAEEIEASKEFNISVPLHLVVDAAPAEVETAPLPSAPAEAAAGIVAPEEMAGNAAENGEKPKKKQGKYVKKDDGKKKKKNKLGNYKKWIAPVAIGLLLCVAIGAKVASIPDPMDEGFSYEEGSSFIPDYSEEGGYEREPSNFSEIEKLDEEDSKTAPSSSTYSSSGSESKDSSSSDSGDEGSSYSSIVSYSSTARPSTSSSSSSSSTSSKPQSSTTTVTTRPSTSQSNTSSSSSGGSSSVSNSGSSGSGSTGSSTTTAPSKPVVKPTTEFKVEPATVTLNVGEEVAIKPTLSCFFNSDDQNIAYVKNGKIVGKQSGECIITATAQNGETFEIKVTVK